VRRTLEPSALLRQPSSDQHPTTSARRLTCIAGTRSLSTRRRPSEALGNQACRESGFGAPDDIGAPGEHIVELRRQLHDKGDDLAAARATNRELMTGINRTDRPGCYDASTGAVTPRSADGTTDTARP
jgi:hypothetical protein